MSRKFVLIGHPVGHSVSPVIHQCAYGIVGIEAEYALADCPSEEDVKRVVARIRSGELEGANVTVPWKQLAFDLADEHAQTARDVGVANVLARNEAGRIIAHNTDASALGQELARAVGSTGVDRTERPGALIIGSGGAALAAVVGCRLSGVEEIFVSARRFDPSHPSETWPRSAAFEALGARLLPWPTFRADAWSAICPSLQLLVQATSAGMKGTSGGEELAALVPYSLCGPIVAYDLVYNPPVTPFLASARAAGLHAVDGLGMLVGQAMDALRIWVGRAPAVEEILPTARKALGL